MTVPARPRIATLCLMIFCAIAQAQEEVETRFSAGLGYRVDSLDWNIAGDLNGANPNVLSELTWEDVGGPTLNLDVRMLVQDDFYFRGTYAATGIVEGRNQDSDYLGDNRSQEISRSNNSADGGSISQYSVAAGWRFRPGQGRTSLIPQVGYGQLRQDLRIRDGFQTLDPLNLFGGVGPIPGLDSSYRGSWKGPFLGFDVEHAASRRVTLRGSAQYHLVEYSADADFNLRADLAHPVSFRHEADGSGLVLAVGGSYALTDDLSLNAALNYQSWSTDAGLDRTFFADGGTADTRLNEVNSDSRGVFVGIEYNTR